jgi:Spy/CpxP family protein refolding chaperone
LLLFFSYTQIMSYTLPSLFLASLLSAAALQPAVAQAPVSTESKAAYQRTVTERAAKIVAKLDGLKAKDSVKVRDVIAEQYVALNDIHEARKSRLAALKAQPPTDATAADAAKAKVEAETTAALDKLHAQYLKKLSRRLNPAQIDQVKDGMTYGVLPITMRAYDDMLPNLTAEQKAQMLAWLTEAREKAMDAGSSEQKHAWFGKYKGKINNYLSAAGIDMNQAGKDWQARIAARKAAGAPQ